ncbi:MAG: DUF502 domain-containing protein [Gemmatimonadales bacterium]|nr:DUF502 domain-containing protein [Gemmatimonadales bacterium]
MIKFWRKHFLTGLLAITPVAITAWILWRFYTMISATMRPWVQRVPYLADNYPEFYLTLVGALSFFLLISLVGMFTRNLIGVAFFRLMERFIERIPVVKSVFSASKQIAGVFLQDRRTAFKKVVLFEYPRRGLFSLGFVTRDAEEDAQVNVFLPTTPNPTSGFMLMIPREDLSVLSIPVEEAIKLIVSGGSIMTSEQASRIAAESEQFPGPSSTGSPGKEPSR